MTILLTELDEYLIEEEIKNLKINTSLVKKINKKARSISD